MDLNLRPLSYDELCQMELLHVVTSTNNTEDSNLSTNTIIPVDNNTISNGTGIGGNTCATTAAAAAALLPIMVIPTSMLTSSSSSSVATNSTIPENYYAAYMPQAAFMLTPTSQISTSSLSSSTSSAAATTLNTATITNPLVTTASCQQQQQQQQQQQYPTINLSKLFESSTLPRRPTKIASFVANSNNNSHQQQHQQHVNNHVNVATNMDESDFEGSECGASVSSASTCIPHFRFNACGMMLQPVQQQQQQHHSQQQNQQQQINTTDEPPNNLIGCGPFSHVMGSFGSLQSSRLMGTLVGVTGSAGLTGTLGRNRRACNMQQGGNTGTQKRVSFKADLVPAEQIVNYDAGYCMDWTNNGLRPGIIQPASITGAQMPAVPTVANDFHNVGMHFDTFMDYQVR